MYNSYDLANVSLAKPAPSSLAEMYIPLWVYSSGVVSTTSTSYVYLQKGSTGTSTSVNSATKLHTLSSNWTTTQKFAFEASLYSNNSSYFANVELYDMTTSAAVGNAYVQTTSTSAIVLRSSQFTLTPGHVYGIGIATSSTGTAYLSKAHLVAFLS